MPHLLLYEMPAIIRDHQDIIFMIVIGAIAGYLAEFIIPGRGFGLLATIIIGIIGAWLGNMLFGSFLHLTHDRIFDLIINSTLGAMIPVIIINLVLGRPKEGKDEKDVYDWENE